MAVPMTTTAINGRRSDRIRQTTIATRSGQSPETSTGATIAVITAAGTAIDQNPELAEKIETTLLEGIEQILNNHGDHIETMIRQTIKDWDADTLMEKLEQQVGPDLQFIRINGTVVGGVAGLVIYSVSNLFF